MLDNIGKKLIGNEDERAVSPVIGVILMVAITVILAAVIAAFVLDLGDSIDQEAQAGVNVDGDGTSNVTVTLSSTSGDTDGVYIVGEGIEDANYSAAGNFDAVLNSTGQSLTIPDDVGEADGGDYSVVAYVGTPGDDADTATTIRTITVES